MIEEKGRGATARYAAAALVVAVVAGVAAYVTTARPETVNGDPVATWTDLAPAELAEMLEAKDFTLVNVHVPYEGELPDTDAFVPFDRINEESADIPSDKGAKLVLYCRTGRMSGEAVVTLAEAGYTNLYQLEGGFEAWEAAGYELLQQ